MQQYLNFGYRGYQQAANNPRSFVAPAGIAFQLIYDDTISARGTVTSSPFSDLYSGDGSHPSVQGSYLAACAIYAFQLQSLSGRLMASEPSAATTYKVRLTQPSLTTTCSIPLDGTSQTLLTLTIKPLQQKDLPRLALFTGWWKCFCSH